MFQAGRGSFIDAAGIKRVAATDLLAQNLPPRVMILEPVLSSKSLALVYGPRGIGKTFLGLGIAWAVSAGESFLKWCAPQPRRVLYVDGEMAASDIQGRLAHLGAAPPTLEFMLADLNRGPLPDLSLEDGQRELEGSWQGARPDLLVLDNLASLVGTQNDDADSWTGLQRWLLTLRRRGMAVLMIHHANKQGNQRGTSRREDLLDIVIGLRRPGDWQPEHGARFELHFEKARGLRGEAAEPIEARVEADEAGVLRWRWQPAHISDLHRVAALLKDGLNPNQIAKELGIPRATTYRMRKRAVEMGLMEGR